MLLNGRRGEASGKGVRQPRRSSGRWARASCAGQDFRLFASGKRHGMIRFRSDYPFFKLSAVSSRGKFVVQWFCINTAIAANSELRDLLCPNIAKVIGGRRSEVKSSRTELKNVHKSKGQNLWPQARVSAAAPVLCVACFPLLAKLEFPH
jgi:hypothetical protein